MVTSCFNGIDTTGVWHTLLQVWCYGFVVQSYLPGGGNNHIMTAPLPPLGGNRHDKGGGI